MGWTDSVNRWKITVPSVTRYDIYPLWCAVCSPLDIIFFAMFRGSVIFRRIQWCASIVPAVQHSAPVIRTYQCNAEGKSLQTNLYITLLSHFKLCLNYVSCFKPSFSIHPMGIWNTVPKNYGMIFQNSCCKLHILQLLFWI